MLKRYTHQHFDQSKQPRIIDYILTDSLIRKYANNCRVYRMIRIHPNQDHRLLMTEMTVPINKKARYVIHKPHEATFDSTYLKDRKIREKFLRQVQIHTTSSDQNTSNLDSMHNTIITAITKAANETIPKKKKTKNKHTWSNDEELDLLIKRRNKELKILPLDKEALKNANKQVKIG